MITDKEIKTAREEYLNCDTRYIRVLEDRYKKLLAMRKKQEEENGRN